MNGRIGESANRRFLQGALSDSVRPRPLAVSPTRPLVLLFATCCVFFTASARAADSTTEPIPPQVQSAVDRGLEWLAAHQDPRTGAWLFGFEGEGPVAASTSLSAMAFMARGHVPGQGPYGENINHAIDCILNLQAPNGLLAHSVFDRPMYEHGISTVMLCEAYGMLDDKRQKRAAAAISKAVALILAAQAIPKDPDDQGGWRYHPDARDSDTSVTGWQLMALRGAANIGAPLPQRAIRDGIAYIKRRAVDTDTGGFAYTGQSGSDAALAGTGILALELLGKHREPESIRAADYLRRNPITEVGNGFYYYTVYYCAQAAWQLGGDYWTDINGPIRRSLLMKQQADGSWPVRGTNESMAGTAYGTSMAILALTVPYRYLPIYQR